MRKSRFFTICFFLVCIFGTSPLKSTHIVGGEIYYECLGNNEYKITMKNYRDCYLGLAPFDYPASLGIFANTDSLVQKEYMYYPGATLVPPETTDPCMQAPLDVCVEEAIYEVVVTLPPIQGGYTLVYQRCCRNNSIANIVDPGESGSTYTTQIPGPELVSCNSSPYFNEFPPIVICAGSPLIFDHSATDPDGDQLVYEFCEPLVGANTFNPMPDPPNSPPFNPVIWDAGFSAHFPLPANPQLQIDPQTGLITGTPNNLGQYVIGVCVKEYRNGVLIGQTLRDFQFNVTECVVDVVAEIPVIDTSAEASKGTEGLYIIICDDYEVSFTNISKNASTYLWDFGDGASSTQFEPVHTCRDTGSYVVSLIANPGSNCADTFDVLVEIYPFFDVDFTTESVCAGDTIYFEDLTQSTFNDVNGWFWDFGDGEVSNSQHPFHVFEAGGDYQVQLNATSENGCNDFAQKSIEIYGSPNVEIYKPPFCLGDTITFNSVIEPLADSLVTAYWTYQNIQYPDSNITIDFDQTGQFDLFHFAENSYGCKQFDTLTIIVDPPPVAYAGEDTAICLLDSAFLQGTGSINFEWEPASIVTNPDSDQTYATPSEDTWFQLRVFDQNGCEAYDSVFVTVNPLPELEIKPDTTICLGDTIMVYASGGVNYWWDFDTSSNVLITENNVNAFPQISTTYTVEADNIFGCRTEKSTVVDVIYPVETNGMIDLEACYEDIIEINAADADFYDWGSGQIISDQQNQQIQISAFYDEQIVVERSNICFSALDTFQLTVHDLPEIWSNENAFEIFLNEQVQLEVLTASNGTIIWDPQEYLDCVDCFEVNAAPVEETTYTATVTSPEGCQSMLKMLIEVIDICDDLIFLPNTFSPNGDGINDVFTVRSIYPLKIEYFRVFDRWGKKVFESRDLNHGWDGTFQNGKEAKNNVYPYQVSYFCPVDGSVVVESGNVTLIR